MRRCGMLLLTLALWTALSGCAGVPYAHEIETTVLMEVLGVDAAGETAVAVSAASAGRAGAGDAQGEEPVILSAPAETVAAACARMQTFGEQFIFFGDVERVLVGEGAARAGVEELLAHIARDPELRLEAGLWVVKGGSAADVLFDGEAGGSLPARLEALERDAELHATPHPRTARAALADLLENGCTLLPALERRRAESGQAARGEYVLDAAGYAVVREGALCGFTGEDESFGADLLLGRGEGRVLELEAPGLDYAALRLVGVKTRVAPRFAADRLVGLQVSCALETRVAEYRGPGGRLGREDRERLEERLARSAEEAVRAAMETFQDLNADCLHLGKKAALAAPWKKTALEEQWEETFPQLELELSLTAEVTRG